MKDLDNRNAKISEDMEDDFSEDIDDAELSEHLYDAEDDPNQEGQIYEPTEEIKWMLRVGEPKSSN
jgi:hypothetical protein